MRAILILLFAQSLFALEPAMTVEDCVRIALENHPSISVAAHSEQSALEDVGIARGKYFPEVFARTGYRRWETHAFLPEGVVPPGGLSSIGPVNEWRANLRAQYTLFDSGLRSSERETAESQHSAAQQEFFRTKSDIAFLVHTRFYEVLAAEKEVEVAEARLDRSHDHHRLATERKSAGAVPQADVTRAGVDVASAELSLVAAQSSLRIARGRLNEAMGRAPDVPLQILGIESDVPNPNEIDVQQSFSRALEKRSEIQAALKRLDAKRSQIRAARSEILPKVRAEAGYGWLDDQLLPDDQDWWVGVTLDIPLFDGGTRSHRIAKSKVEVQKEEAQIDLLKLSVRQEVWAAYSRWIEAHQALETNQARKEQAEESLRLTTARYEEGAGTINDLLDSELALDRADTDLNIAHYHLYIARAAYLHSTGEL